MPIQSPAIALFIERIAPELEFGEVWIQRLPNRFELRHCEDRSLPLEDLESVEVEALLGWAQCTGEGNFRPLKSAPTLRRGWCAQPRNAEELERAVQQLYPGGLADWFAVETNSAVPADFRSVAERQTGMYRIVAMLNDRQVVQAVAAICSPQFCLKRRLWTAPGLAADPPANKSLIACLEPCPLFLEFARRAMRIAQEQSLGVTLCPSDAVSIIAALEDASPNGRIREADFASPRNPHRVRLALEKLRQQLEGKLTINPALAIQGEEE